jgi:hypothetical protein
MLLGGFLGDSGSSPDPEELPSSVNLYAYIHKRASATPVSTRSKSVDPDE